MKLIKTKSTALLAVLVACFFVTVNAAEPLRELSIAAPEIRPFVFNDDENIPQGAFVDLLRKFEQTHNVDVKVVILPWARALNEVKLGKIDALMPAMYSEERAKFLAYPTTPLFTFGENILVKRKEDPFVFDKIDDIGKNRLIGKMRHVLMGDDFELAYKQGEISIHETRTLDEAFMMLIQSRVDLVISDKDIAFATIKELGLESDIDTMNISDNSESSYLCFSKAFAAKYDINAIVEKIGNLQLL